MNKLTEKIRDIPNGIKSGIVYTFSTLFTRGLAIITIPIFTRLMTTDQIGVVNLYNSWYSMISVFATLSLTSGGFQLAMKEFKNSRDQYESSVLSITSLMAILIGIIYFVNTSFWEGVLGLPKSLIILMLVGFLVAPARDFWMARQRYEYKYKLSGLVSILSAVAASALSVAVVLHMNSIGAADVAEGRLLANYAVIYGVAGVFWVFLFVKGKKLYDKKFWKYSLTLSLPLVGYAIARQILDVSDRMMISKMVGNDKVGIYSTLYTVSSISLVAWNAINASFIPYLYQNIDNSSKKKNVQRLASILLALYAAIAIVLTFLAPEIVRILATNEYYEAIYIMPPIAAGIFLTSVSNMYSNILVYYKRTNVIMFSSAFAAFVNIVLNYIFIKTIGYQAAAYTTLIAYILLALIEGIFASKEYKKVTNDKMMIYNNKVIVIMALVTILVSMCGLFFYSFSMIRYLLCIAFEIIAIVIAMYYKRNGQR